MTTTFAPPTAGPNWTPQEAKAMTKAAEHDKWLHESGAYDALLAEALKAPAS